MLKQDLEMYTIGTTSRRQPRGRRPRSDETERGKEQIIAARKPLALSLHRQDSFDPQDLELCPQCTGRFDDVDLLPWGKLPGYGETEFCKACTGYWKRWNKTGAPRMWRKQFEIDRVATKKARRTGTKVERPGKRQKANTTSIAGRPSQVGQPKGKMAAACQANALVHPPAHTVDSTSQKNKDQTSTDAPRNRNEWNRLLRDRPDPG